MNHYENYIHNQVCVCVVCEFGIELYEDINGNITIDYLSISVVSDFFPFLFFGNDGASRRTPIVPSTPDELSKKKKTPNVLHINMVWKPTETESYLWQLMANILFNVEKTTNGRM